jgi:predicted lipoprotein with Yx(FWY)xxD motif
MQNWIAIAGISLALVIAGCGGDDDTEQVDAADASAAEEQPSEPERPAGRDQPPGTEISTSRSQLGETLFDGDDQAIYYFEPERTSEPRCYGSCAEAWPPVLTEGEPKASGDARQRLLATTERRDGSVQVTYDGRPLYYYADEGPGELRCHNIHHEGGLWLAVQPDGDPVPYSRGDTVFLD